MQRQCASVLGCKLETRPWVQCATAEPRLTWLALPRLAEAELTLTKVALTELMADLVLLFKLTLQRKLLEQLRDLSLLNVSGCDRIDPVQQIATEPRSKLSLLTKLRALLDDSRRDRIKTERRSAELLLRQVLGKLSLLD